MKLILKTIKIISVIFISIAFLGCEDEQPDFPKAFAEFTYTVNNQTGVAKFINTSRNATIFNWSFGDQTTSTEINPVHVYQPGTYTVTLVARNVAGSFRSFQDTITVGENSTNPGGGGSDDCTAETNENIDPANGDLNWTFLTNAATHTFEAFGNTGGQIVANPVIDDINASCNVQQFVKTAGCETWSGLGAELATALDFTTSTTNKVFTMKVLAENQAAAVTLRLERLPFPDTDPAVERVATITQVGAWEELTFDFSDVTSGTYKSMIIYFERNASCDGDVYYFDDIKQVASTGGGGGGGSANCVAETTESIAASDLNITFQTNTPTVIDDNAQFSWIDNPDFGGTVNNSCKVGQVVRLNNSPFDNIQIDLADKLDFSTSEGIKMKVWSPIANTPVLLKLEEIGNAANFVEILQTTGAANTWTELTYDFAATATPQFNKMVIFFNFNVADASTYFFDDLLVYGTPGGGGGGTGGTGGGCASTAVPATGFPVNFESCESFLSTFTDSGSITTTLDDNPSKSGINTSDFVLRVDKAAGSNRWAGFQNPFPSNFDATKTFKVKVYSTEANVVMKFEVNSDPQSPDSGNPGPQYATITNANTWTEVEIVFTGIPPNNTGLNQFVIKPNNPEGTDGQTTSSNATYYFDDIRLE